MLFSNNQHAVISVNKCCVGRGIQAITGGPHISTNGKDELHYAVSTLFVRLQHWPCSLSLLQAHNTIANTGFHTPAFDTSTRSEKITTLWSLNRRRLRVIHKREAPSSKYLLFAAGNSCVCVHFPALPVAFQVGCISSQLPSASCFFRRFH